MKKILAAVIAAALLLVAAPVSADGHIPSTVETVVAVSGDPGDFDKDKKDFDILRELVLLAGLADALGDGEGSLTDITVLAPTDKAFQRLAKDLGYDGKYDEGAILGFLAGGLTAYADANGTDVITVITSVLLYHVAGEAYTNKELKKADSVDTLLGVSLDSKNKKFIDGEDDLKNAKLKGVKDVATSNGYIQGIDRVLIPVPDLVN
ncbi:MAG: fasciclin domain-containing protein [Acidimicrobiia bacterium]|nr:fasciclin domain-containing protein [Acidimicrobiia bacterium]NNC74981.1 fasciclin domain-containing protein [Acidimicrobiia bacterium]NNK92054.1 fasciclin domain-containing protein [Acidimicrobiia bacterium]